MKALKDINWSTVAGNLFYAMFTAIALYVASSIDELTKSVGQLNVEMRGVVVQLSANSEANKELKQKSEAMAGMIYDLSGRVKTLEADKR